MTDTWKRQDARPQLSPAPGPKVDAERAVVARCAPSRGKEGALASHAAGTSSWGRGQGKGVLQGEYLHVVEENKRIFVEGAVGGEHEQHLWEADG